MADSALRRRLAWTALLRVFKPGTPGLGKRLSAIPRMIKATVKGEYDGGTRLALLAASAVYIVSPIDAVPELFLLVLGVVDDLAMADLLRRRAAGRARALPGVGEAADNVIPGTSSSSRSRRYTLAACATTTTSSNWWAIRPLSGSAT